MKNNYIALLIAATSLLMLCQCAAPKKLKIAEENKETVRIWYEEGWNNNRNNELIERCFSEQWSDGNPLLPDEELGREGMRLLVQKYREALTDSKFTITHLFGDEHFVAIRYEVVSTHSGDFFGIPATGKRFTSTGIVLYEMEDGKIKSSYQELDVRTIINQLKD